MKKVRGRKEEKATDAKSQLVYGKLSSQFLKPNLLTISPLS